MVQSRLRGHVAPPAPMWDRVLLGAVAVVAFIVALLVRNDKNTSTLALFLAGLAGLLGVLALLLPYVAGLSGSVAGVSLAFSFVAARPEGLADQVGSLSGHLDPISGKATVTASGRTALSEVVRGPDVEYAVINLGRGDQWLASRLLIFTLVMQQLRQVRCIVLVAATKTDARERLLGLVAADDLRRALAWEYPWLEARLFEAWQTVSTATVATPPGQVRVARLNADLAEALFNAYVTGLRAGVPGADSADWTELQYGDWEHSRLLHGDDLGTVLGGSLDNRAIPQSRSRSRQFAGVLSIEAQYVALVDRDHRFVSLVDRQALLEDLATQNRAPNGGPPDTA
jgi:hypothetical protein